MPRKRVPPPTLDELKAGAASLPRQGLDVGAKTELIALAGKRTQATSETEGTKTRLKTLLAEKKTEAAVASAMGWDSAKLALFLDANRTWATQDWFPMVGNMARSAKLAEKANRSRNAKPDLVALGDTLWTPEMRQRLIEAYVDTGDLLKAQEIVGVTPSQFNTEVDNNPEFSERVKAAKKHASNTLELRAIQEGLGGNDKLLSLILRKDEDVAGVSQLTDDQLARRLDSYLARVRSRLDASRTGADDARGTAQSPGDSDGDGEPTPTQ